MNKQEVKITFTGPPGSGKTTFMRIAAKAIEEAGHEVMSESEFDPDLHYLKVVFNKNVRRRVQ